MTLNCPLRNAREYNSVYRLGYTACMHDALDLLLFASRTEMNL